MRRGYIGRYLEALGNSDPIAIGITVVFGLGLLFVGVIGVLELLDKQKEKRKKTRSSKPRRSQKR